ncbi:carboxypeptidase regulatory-like domain-containing protein [Streptomyces sp. NPDC059215]|uniref:carboxypeptidase regulatory-like domain-containing protein n=1 Tax=Streptomyces sp. NPDC059215 TaxID=3346772 RepID=UPI0036A15056
MAAAVLATVLAAVDVPEAVASPAGAHSAQTVKASPASNSVKGSGTKRAHGKVERVCGEAKPGMASCLSLRRTDTRSFRGLAKAGEQPDGLGATDIRDAYTLPADGGSGQTIAIVDAFDDPSAEADLEVYRSQYGLPACTSDTGCFRKVDQRGGKAFPEPDLGWSTEIALDLDMVSAAAPRARILLVEADDNSSENLSAAVNQAVAMGAKFVSNSYGIDESMVDPTRWDSAYNHPGVAIVASSGDDGHGVGYPASSQYVTAVGGTSLVRAADTDRGWTESVWSGAGSGCSQYEPKPDFQNDTECTNRTVADVSALADPETGAAVYQTYGGSGWTVIGGTSASAPIIAGVYAQAGTPGPGTYPNSYPYAASRSALHDVTTGSNGDCDRAYLCNGVAGYDGPTGLGTPNGPTAFRDGPHGKLHGTVLNAADGSPVAGAEIEAGGSTAYTGTDGSYKLALPSGPQTITVGGYGYRTKTFTQVEVLDKTDTKRNFTITALPTSRISGTVKDGSGHGWPLYAKISVDGKPGAPVWTDPATGAYHIDLPKRTDYTLRVVSFYPGYEQSVDSVKLAKTDVSADFALQVDPRAGKAPGYAVKHEGDTETFESTSTAPKGWSVSKADGTTGGWRFDDPRYRGNKTGGAGSFAIADSGYGDSVDSTLNSPSYDFSHEQHPDLSFDTDYVGSWSQQASVDVSTDGARNWSTVWEAAPAFADIKGPAGIRVDLSAYAGQADVRLRFHFQGDDAWYWQIDDVQVAAWTANPQPGGLITGQVTDANTASGIAGVEVSNAIGDKAITVATPDDVTLPDGLFWMFTTSGTQKLTAVRKPYLAVSKTVSVASDSSAPAGEFALPAGRLSVSTGGVDADVRWGASASRSLTVQNSGSAAVHVRLDERPGGMQVAAGGTAQGPGTAWQAASDLPMAMIDGLADAYRGKLYAGLGGNGNGPSRKMMVYDPISGAWSGLASPEDARVYPAHGFIGGKLYVAGGFAAGDHHADAKLEIYDPGTNTWTTGADLPSAVGTAASTVLNGKLYVVGGCVYDFACGENAGVSVYDPVSDTWTQAADYPQAVAANACAGIENKIYCAGGTANVSVTSGAYDLSAAYVYDPSTDAWSRLPDMPFPLWRSAYASASGRLVMAGGQSLGKVVGSAVSFDPATSSWSQLPAMSKSRTGAAGATGFYAVGGIADGVSIKVTEVLPGYDQPDGADITWMSVSDQQLTLQPGQTSKITVGLDASAPEITQPGTYRARLQMGSDTPYVVQDVPISMTVAPPAAWGKVTGTVTSAATGKPLAGATVEIDSWVSDTTLTTDLDGSYELWLDKRNNPLSVIVAKDGYKPVTATVKVVKGAVVITDFALKKA